MIIDISEDGRTIEWWSNGERKITTIYKLIDVYDGIVRCKDCKHLNKEEMRCFEVEGLGYRNVADDDFCSRGERKEVDNETT